jgi:hypothetical protein
MTNPNLSRWTRGGVLHFEWNAFEFIEKLVLTPSIRQKLTRRLEVFAQGERAFHSLHLPWRYGMFFFGPTGSGKTAASRAVARLLDWEHFTIPAHEILDSHLLEMALSEGISQSRRVIVLEDVDRMIQVMEPEVFFELLDHSMERGEGTVWIATSRHAENTPKTQLIRPGRFDELVRFELPQFDLRKELLLKLRESGEPGVDKNESVLSEFAEMTEGLTFAHFEELRRVLARSQIEDPSTVDYWAIVRAYIEDQMIAGDRLGGLSDSTLELQERVRQIDSRVLMAALDMTDVFRRLIEKVIGDASQKAQTDLTEEAQ